MFTGVEYNGTRVPCHSKNKFFILYKEQTLIIYFGILTGLAVFSLGPFSVDAATLNFSSATHVF